MPLNDDFIPEIYIHNLTNQMKIVGMEYTRTPWVSITYMAQDGLRDRSPGKGGTADCLAECLTLGTKQKDQLELALTIEGRGAMIRAHGTWDHTLITLEGLAEDFPTSWGFWQKLSWNRDFRSKNFFFYKSAGKPS